MGSATKDTRPSKDFAALTQNGLTAHALAMTHQAALEARFGATLLPDLATDLESFGAKVPGAKQAHKEAHAATATQDSALSSGYALVTAVRGAAARSGASSDVCKAYGVGVKVNPKVVKDVKAAMGLIIDRATKYPDEAKSLGLLAKDVTALTSARSAIHEADAAQEKKRSEAPLSTKARNEAGRRVEAAIDRIIGAGMLEFAQNATERAKFEALIGRGNPAAKVKQKGAEAKGAKPKEG